MSDELAEWIGRARNNEAGSYEAYCMHCMVTEGPYEEGESDEDFVAQHSQCTYPIAGTVVEIDPTGKSRFMQIQSLADGRAKTEPEDQPIPTPNGRDAIAELVMDDIRERMALGTRRYGTPLQAFNGRNALQDAYEEALDLSCYLRQAIEEAKG